MKLGVHIVKESQTATGQTAVVASEQNPQHDIYSGSLQRLHCWYPCDVLYKHTHTHTYTYLSCDVGPVKAYYTAAGVAGSSFQTSYSCIRMERLLPTVITNVLLPPPPKFPFFFFLFPLTFLTLKMVIIYCPGVSRFMLPNLIYFFRHSKGLNRAWGTATQFSVH